VAKLSAIFQALKYTSTGANIFVKTRFTVECGICSSPARVRVDLKFSEPACPQFVKGKVIPLHGVDALMVAKG
jgi:hypothetical protein